MPLDTSITPDRIAETERLIRPHVRHTPVVHVDLSEFGGRPRPVALKLECLMHAFDQPETLLGQGTSAARSTPTCPTSTRCWSPSAAAD